MLSGPRGKKLHLCLKGVRVSWYPTRLVGADGEAPSDVSGRGSNSFDVSELIHVAEACATTPSSKAGSSVPISTHRLRRAAGCIAVGGNQSQHSRGS